MVKLNEFLKRRRCRLAAGLATCLLALGAPACSGSRADIDMNATSDVNQKGPLPADAAPVRKLNPAPRDAYDIRVVLEDPPGPFAEIDAAAQYDVANPGECGEPHPLSGAVPRISTNEFVKLRRMSDTEFVGRVFADQVLDEDYYGRGVCHWEFIEVRVAFRASADPMSSWFIATLQAEAIRKGSSKATFFWAGHYPKAEIDNYSTIGHTTLDHVEDANKHEFFEVEISAQQARP